MALKPRSILMILAENVRTLMRKKDMTDAKLADKAGVDKKTVNNVINGRFATQIDKVDAIARALDVQTWELFIDGMGQALSKDGKLGNVIEAYGKTDDSGRESILKVAEIAIRPYRSE